MKVKVPNQDLIDVLLDESKAQQLSHLLEFNNGRADYSAVPAKGGVYVFYIDLSQVDKSELQTDFTLLGPGGRDIDQTWEPFLKKSMNLAYVGKTTNLNNRLRLHLCLGREPFGGQGKIVKPTTSCQYRAGFDHLFYRKDVDFRSEGLGMTYFNYVELDGDEHLFDRFYLETLAIGLGRPVFNVDGER